jgi:hypothetical protein
MWEALGARRVRFSLCGEIYVLSSASGHRVAISVLWGAMLLSWWVEMMLALI